MAKKSSILEQPTRGNRKTPKRPPSMARDVEGVLQNRGLRETIESVVIAVVLAFLFRTFVAEPFVIPTGSMAPTLQGRHQSVNCPICNFTYRTGSSGELNNNYRVGTTYLATCPQCGFVASTNKELATKIGGQGNSSIFSSLTLELAKDTSSSGGDRILVSKSAYEFDDPQRWDVFVFHFPGDAAKNYIKRLVGLPGETIRIKHGDVFSSPDMTNDLRDAPTSDFTILRKPAHVIQAMRQLVYDNDYAAAPNVVQFMTSRNWPTRWFNDQGSWQSQDHKKSFTVEAAAEPQWLRYRHVLASLDDWRTLLGEGQATPGELPTPLGKPQLVADGYAYNGNALSTINQDGQLKYRPIEPACPGMNWTGDLIVECQLESRSGQGEVTLELVEGGIRFQCLLDIAAGTATLQIVDPQNQLLAFESLEPNEPVTTPQTSVPFKGQGSHQVSFANVDDQLHLWIDGTEVEFDEPTRYPRLGNISPTPLDLYPVGIAATGANVRVDGLRLYRDVYYVASEHSNQRYCDLKTSVLTGHMLNMSRDDYLSFDGTADLGRKRAAFFSDPQQWRDRNTGTNTYENTTDLTFTLRQFPENPDNDQFFALGDNSPQSQDSRLWWQHTPGLRPFVERKLIIGRAMVIYWPLGNIHFIQ